MAETATPLQVGLAEFVGRLIREVLDSVTSAQIEQEQRQAELLALAAKTAAEAAGELVADEEVEAELARLFPSPLADRPHAIYIGAAYRPPAAQVSEEPPIVERVGVALRPAVGYATGAAGTVLTAQGVEEVREAVRRQLAPDRLAALRRFLERGTVPRIQVDRGRILTKTTFQLVSEEGTPAASPALSADAELTARGRKSFPAAAPSSTSTAKAAASPAALPLRLTVRQASERSPVSSRLQVDVYGEVEIHFKTV